MRVIMSTLQLVASLPSLRPYPSRSSTAAAAFHKLSRDRIGSDGHLLKSSPTTTTPPTNSNNSDYVIGSPIPNTSPAPAVPPPTATQLDQLADFFSQNKGGILVLTGAGCSTESDVPDYRGPGGAYSTGFKPMTHQAFVASERNRSRYWQRSFAGWERFSTVQPNSAHHGISALQAAGYVDRVITQNVDRLHHKAGSTDVVELHGTTHEVVCLNCNAVTGRDEVQLWLARLNPEAALAAASLERARATLSEELDQVEVENDDERQRLLRAGTTLPVATNLREAAAGVIRPDGDVEVEFQNSEKAFMVPPCPSCGGVLKPDVVFFGDSLPKWRAQQALELAQNASGVVVVGSSLAVWSAYRLIKAAKEVDGRHGAAPVAIVNVGPTRADDVADLKFEVRAGDAMQGLMGRLVGK